MNMKALGFAAALACAALPAASFDMADMSADERASFRAEIRAYLLENPEVLMEAIAVLENREAQAQAEADKAMLTSNLDALYNDGYSWVGGNPDGDITIVEFIDYRCGFCRKAFPEVTELVESDGNIKLVVKEFPILGEQSVLSARFAIAVLQLAGNDAYKAVHEALIAERAEISEASLSAIGSELELDMDAVFVQMNSPDVDAVIAQNRALAQSLGISGTPTFVMADQLLRGYVPLDGMRQLVDEARSR